MSEEQKKRAFADSPDPLATAQAIRRLQLEGNIKRARTQLDEPSKQPLAIKELERITSDPRIDITKKDVALATSIVQNKAKANSLARQGVRGSTINLEVASAQESVAQSLGKKRGQTKKEKRRAVQQAAKRRRRQGGPRGSTESAVRSTDNFAKKNFATGGKPAPKKDADTFFGELSREQNRPARGEDIIKAREQFQSRGDSEPVDATEAAQKLKSRQIARTDREKQTAQNRQLLEGVQQRTRAREEDLQRAGEQFQPLPASGVITQEEQRKFIEREIARRRARENLPQEDPFAPVDKVTTVIDDSQKAVEKFERDVVTGSQNLGRPAREGDIFVIGSTPTARRTDKEGQFVKPLLAGQVAAQTARPTGQTVSPQSDPLAVAISDLEKAGKESKDPLTSFGVGAAKEFAGFGASLVNLERKGGELFVEAIRGTDQPSPKEIPIPETAPGQLLEGPIEGVAKSIETGDITQIGTESQKGAQKFAESFQSNPAESAGSLAAFLLPVSPKAVKLFPLRLQPQKIVTGVRPATKTVTKEVAGKKVKTTEEIPIIAEETVARTLSFGFGGPKSKPLLTKVGKKVVKGSGKKEINISKLNPQDRGFESLTRNPLEERFLTSEEGIKQLKSLGATPEDIQIIKSSQRVTQAIKGLEPEATVKKFPERTFENLEPKQQKVLIDFIRKEQKRPIGRLGTFKGSTADILQVQKKRQLPAKDFEADEKNLKNAIQRAERLTKALEPTARKGQQFVQRKDKVFLVEKGQEKKIAEFLSPDSDDIEVLGQLAKTSKVAGVERVKTPVKVEKTKGKALQSQILDRLASISTIQGPESSGTVSGRISVGAPFFRQTKDVSRAIAGLESAEILLIKRGKAAKAAIVKEERERLKKIFEGRGVDIEGFFKSAKPETFSFGKAEPSTISQFAKSTTAKASAGVTVSKTSTLSAPTPKQTRFDLSKASAPKEEVSITAYSSFSPVPSGVSAALPSTRSGFPSRSIVRSDTPRISQRGSQQSRPSRGPQINIAASIAKSKPKKKQEPSIIPTSPASPSRGGPSSLGPSFTASPGPSPGSTLTRSPASPSRGFGRFGGVLPGENLVTTRPAVLPGAGLILRRDEAKPKDRLFLGPSDKIFAVDSSDPFRPGVIFTAGVPEFQVSKSADLFEKIDVQLAKARRKKGADRVEFPDLTDFSDLGSVGARRPQRKTVSKPRRKQKSAITRKAGKVRTAKMVRGKVRRKKPKKKASKRSKR